MARIRTVKPEFFTSDSVCSVSPLARLLFIGLWCESDREGRLKYKPKTLKIRYLPVDTCDIETLCQELISEGMIELYSVDDDEYCEIPGFAQHQVINNREAESIIPPRVKVASPRVKGEGRKGREGKGREGKGREGKEGKELGEILIPDGINASAWNEWTEYRKSKKKTVSQAAANKQFKLLAAYSPTDQQKIIDNSISNDYQGLFELKGNSNGQHQQATQPKPSLLDRVKAGAEQRERERAARAGREFDGQGMDEANGDVRPQVHEPVRGDAGRYMGNLLEGDFSQTDS